MVVIMTVWCPHCRHSVRGWVQDPNLERLEHRGIQCDYCRRLFPTREWLPHRKKKESALDITDEK